MHINELGRFVAEYLTELPPKEVLQHKLHMAIEYAQATFEARHARQDWRGDA